MNTEEFTHAIHKLAEETETDVNHVLAAVIKVSAIIHMQDGVIFEEYKKLMNDYVNAMRDNWPIG